MCGPAIATRCLLVIHVHTAFAASTQDAEKENLALRSFASERLYSLANQTL